MAGFMLSDVFQNIERFGPSRAIAIYLSKRDAVIGIDHERYREGQFGLAVLNADICKRVAKGVVQLEQRTW